METIGDRTARAFSKKITPPGSMRGTVYVEGSPELTSAYQGLIRGY